MKWIRDIIAGLDAYVPGKQVDTPVVKLNANENPYPPSPAVLAVIARCGTELCRLYPDALATRLRQIAADQYGVDPAQVIAGNGSDDILTMIMRAFLDPGDRIAVVDPTYTLYQTLAAMQAADTEVYPLDESFGLPEAFFDARAKLTLLPNPNAQTGTLFSREQIMRLCETRGGLVVIDEAYAPFAGATVIDLLPHFENLIVTRTLSKSHSLAGLRVGFGLAAPEIISALMKVKDSYNVNAVSQAAGIAALRDEAYTRRTVQAIRSTLADFTAALRQRDWQVLDSSANFVLCKPPGGSAAEIVKLLETRGCLVRYFDTPRLAPYIRISIGTDQQMQELLHCIDQYCMHLLTP